MGDQHETFDAQMERVKAVHAEYSERLLRLPHVLGLAIGYATCCGKDTGELALIVLVDQKLPEALLDEDERIPHEIDGVRVDVRELGTFTAG